MLFFGNVLFFQNLFLEKNVDNCILSSAFALRNDNLLPRFLGLSIKYFSSK